MKKLLYIAPHLSTGGLPQYLTKKIELLKNEYEIHLVEWADVTGGVLVVTRNKIKALIPDERFYTLRENKHELFDIIDRVQPDIIHSEEIPEFYMDNEIAQKLYSTDRKYAIVETSHDSSFDTTQKRFFPDKFMFVSNWQIDQYKDVEIPKVLVEYPIEYTDRPNREEALRSLGLDPSKKHVLHVGLYTSRKNQKEFFEYAKQIPDVEFHSLGNRADNFKWYWEPLANDTPPNLTWWNERTDVDKFYQSMDLFLFTSRGSDNDKETMPLVIREAISAQIPTLIYNLEVYQNYFDKFDKVNYLKFDDFDSNISRIKEMLGRNDFATNKSKEAFIISTYPVTQAIIDTTKQCIEAVKATGRKVILTSHIPIPEELDKVADYSINDNNNILTKHTYYSNSWYSTSDYKINVNLRGEDNDVYHGPTCYTNYYNGAALAKNLGFNKLFFLNYDYILKNDSYIDEISKVLETKDAFFGDDENLEGKQIVTWFVAVRPELFLKLPVVTNAKEYDDLMPLWGAESNGYENMLHHAFKNTPNVHWESKDKFYDNTRIAFEHKDYSRVEYFTVLPSNKPGVFAPYIQVSNSNDSRLIKYSLYKNNELVKEVNHEVTGKLFYHDLVEFEENDSFEVKFESYDLDTNVYLDSKIIIVDKDYRNNKISKNGLFEFFNL